jgi:hypothetical protein
MSVDCAPTADFGVSDVVAQGSAIGGLVKQEVTLWMRGVDRVVCSDSELRKWNHSETGHDPNVREP